MRKIIKILLAVLIIFISTYGVIYLTIPPIYIDNLNHIEVISSDENKSYSLINSSLSSYTKLEEVSDEFLTTLVTIEDKRFYSHNGIDYLRTLKSLITNIENNEITQGGSTITQQVARIAYLDNSKSYIRKIKEYFYAKKIEDEFSKEDILEMYINNCYFAHNIYGIKQASLYYFDKLPSELTYSESALLVGIINAPNLYAPDIDYQASINKQQSILKTLLSNNIFDIQTYYKEANSKLNLVYNDLSNNQNLLYYQDAINEQLNNYNLLTKRYLRQGIKIESNLDLEVYEKVNNIIKKHQNNVKNDEISVVVMKPYSSKVLTLIGGFDYTSSQYNRALKSKRQIGSTIKPFLYYLGLEQGMTPLTQFVSEETTFNINGIGLYSPKNASGTYANRKINMVEAISLSDNIYAIKTTLLVGSKNLANLLNKFSIVCENINPTLGLGSISLSPLELTSLYNCLASEGVYYKPSFVNKVSLQDGTLLKTFSSKSTKILNSDLSLIINHLLKSPFDTSLTSYTYPSLGSYQTKSTFSAKTGSTESTNWVVGYNPNYTICVYVGNDDNSSISNPKLARTIFQEIANELTENKGDIFYEPSSKLKGFTLTNSLINRQSKTYYQHI